MDTRPSWGGIPADRIVAVVADLDTGQVQVGSGYLVTGRQVLTARHCTVDKRTGRPARSLRVVRLSTGAQATATLFAAALDVAVLMVSDDAAWVAPEITEATRFGRVDRSHSAELHDCQAVGFPLWQLDPNDQQRNAAELHGTIRLIEDCESGLLVMRDPLLDDVAVPATVAAGDRSAQSTWGGLSGALVFHEGIALGVVIEHHPRQGRSAVRILPAERFAAPPAGGDADIAAVAAALGLPSADKLPLAAGQHLASSLGSLVELLVDGQLPRMEELDPYRLGATASKFGNDRTYGQRDEYVSRAKDEPLAAALLPGRLVVLVGQSKVGKTRTAFEVLRSHSTWGCALLASPVRRSLSQLAGHPAVSGPEPLVIWLDDLQRFLPPTGELSQAVISRLLSRPGPTLLIATLRSEQRDQLRGPDGEMTREVRVILDSATTIELRSTKEDPDEQARAAAVYLQIDLRDDGLAEMLAGVPELLRRYRDSAAAQPLLHILVQTSVDWARCGLARPISKADLLAFARDSLAETRPDLDPRDDEMEQALRQARKPFAGGGQVPLLRSPPSEPTRYVPFDYLIAADDGQDPEHARRPVTDTTWWRFLDRVTWEDASYIGAAAYQRDNLRVAVAATRRAAQAAPAGHPGNAAIISNLGSMLHTRFERRGEIADLDAAINAGQQALDLTPPGHPNLPLYLSNLGIALHTRFGRAGDWQDLDAAIGLGRKAVELTPPGHPNLPLYLSNLGNALHTRFRRSGDPGDLDAAIDAGRKAVELTPPGHPSRAAMLSNLDIALLARLERTGELGDLDTATEATRHAVEANPGSRPDQAQYLSSLASALHSRFKRTGDPADLDTAIQAARQAVAATPGSSPDLTAYLSNLGSFLLTRFERDGDRADLDAAVDTGRHTVDLTPPGHPNLPLYLSNLGASLLARFGLSRDAADLDAAIELRRQAAHLIPPGHPDLAMYLSNLGNSLLARFGLADAAADLDAAINLGRQAADLTPPGHPDLVLCLSNLGDSLRARFGLTGHIADLDAAISLWRHQRKRECVKRFGRVS